MGDQGPEYTLRRPVDIYQPLPIVFQQDDEESGGYFVQEDGMASKTRPSASDQAVGHDVPVPVVSLIDDDVELSKFPRPTHLMFSARLDTDTGQSVEYDANDDDEDFIEQINRLVPSDRRLTPEILESYIDYFEKLYLFSKGQSKLPVKPVLLRKHALQKCTLCDFADPDQPVLECHGCGIVVHSACYHNVLYDTRSGLTRLEQRSKNASNLTSKGKKTASTRSGKSNNSDERSTPEASTRRASASRGGKKTESVKKQPSRAKPVVDESVMDVDESIDVMDIDGDGEVTPDVFKSTDVYRTPFSDQVHDDGTWWCAKCSSDKADQHVCDLCGGATGAIFPRFILDETGKPRILNKRKPFLPHSIQQVHANASEAPPPKQEEIATEGERPSTTSSTYTPVHIRSPRPDNHRRRGRRPRANIEKEVPDIIWFHDICARAKPRLYCHLVDPTRIEDDDELAIPASDDESEPSEKSSSVVVSEPVAPTPRSRSKAAASKAADLKKAAAASAPVMLGDRNRNCRLCNGHTGACVVCSEPGCGRHFHAHCAEYFGLTVERDEPMIFKCRLHSMTEHALEDAEFHPLFQLLSEEESQLLHQELQQHDQLVAQHKPQTFGMLNGPKLAGGNRLHAGIASTGTHASTNSHSKSSHAKPSKMPTPSYSVPRPALLPLENPMPQFIFNFWILKRLAVGHELEPRLRLIKQDEMRHQEFVDAVSDMEENLRRMVLLRQHMERIRMIVDLCKKREGLKKQQIDDLAELLDVPGVIEYTRTRAFGSSAAHLVQPGSTPNKSRKLTAHSTPRSTAHAMPSPAHPASSAHTKTNATGQSHSTPHRSTASTKSGSTPKSSKASSSATKSASSTQSRNKSTAAASMSASKNARGATVVVSPSSASSQYTVSQGNRTLSHATPNKAAAGSATKTQNSAKASGSASRASTTHTPTKLAASSAARASGSAGAAGNAEARSSAKTTSSTPSRASGSHSVSHSAGRTASPPRNAKSTGLGGTYLSSASKAHASASPLSQSGAASHASKYHQASPTGSSTNSIQETSKVITAPVVLTRLASPKRSSASPSSTAVAGNQAKTIASPRTGTQKKDASSAMHPPLNGLASLKRATDTRQAKAAAQSTDGIDPEAEIVDVEQVSPRGAPAPFSPHNKSPPTRATRRSVANMHYQNGDPGFCNVS